MGQSLFIVWRESVEALLVIGILHAWLRQQPAAGGALRMLWSGVAGALAWPCCWPGECCRPASGWPVVPASGFSAPCWSRPAC